MVRGIGSSEEEVFFFFKIVCNKVEFPWLIWEDKLGLTTLSINKYEVSSVVVGRDSSVGDRKGSEGMVWI